VIEPSILHDYKTQNARFEYVAAPYLN